MWFMKKHAGFSIDEMMNLYPFEFEIFYYMAVNDFKEEHKNAKAAIQELGRKWQ